MKRLIPLFALLLAVAAAPVFALDDANRNDRDKRTLVDDVIRMSQAGVSDDAIISFVTHTRVRFDVTADDMIAMTNAHVSKEVVKAIVDEAADRRNGRRYGDRTAVYVAPPYYGWYDPFFYPYYYDPFYYGPRVSIGFRFGGYFRGRHR